MSVASPLFGREADQVLPAESKPGNLRTLTALTISFDGSIGSFCL
jgi:hypothetical protein